MQSQLIIRILGVLLLLFSITMLAPLAVTLVYQDGGGKAFFVGLLVSLICGLVLYLPRRNITGELRVRDGFVVVVMFWSLLSLFAAIPLHLSGVTHYTIADSVFEAFSGLTTTGATVLSGIDNLPHSILFYRQELQWIGGMGIIVFAVAILPMLGIGGMQLYRAEAPGPVKDTKLTPRIAGTARALSLLYFGLTVACTLAYWGAGMNLFDAVAHSFSTISIGGFSTHDQSIGWFDSVEIEMIAIVFMILSAANFSLHFVAVRRLSIAPYSRDPEFRAYISVLGVVSVIALLALMVQNQYGFSKAIRESLFQTVSIATTTGFTSGDYASWPLFLPVILMFISFIGGCSGSTGGGMKVIRFLLLFKQGAREINKLIHPNAIFKIRLGKQSVPGKIIEAVWGFFATYILLFFVLMLALMTQGLDQVSAFSAVAACMNNLGPGLEQVANNYAHLTAFAKWVLVLAMLLGRLEIFTLLILFSRDFWRS